MVDDEYNLKEKILNIAFKYRLSHLSSYFTSVSIIDSIYSDMSEQDIFILSSGHAALALYVCLEKHKGIDAEQLFLKHGGHPHRDEKNFLHCSTGSLGLGITIALGRAIANPDRKVYVLISDGECAEGSVWESLKTIVEQKIDNVEVHVNMNGYAAYDTVDEEYLTKRLKAFLPSIKIHKTNSEEFSFLHDLNAHYHIMCEEDYYNALSEL